MKKHFPHISTFFLTLVLVFVVGGFIFPKITEAHFGLHATCVPPEYDFVTGCRVPLPGEATVAGGIGTAIQNAISVGADILLGPLGWFAILVLQLATLITWLSGSILNFIVQFTVVDMSDNLNKANMINDTWKIIRDVANMGFIFVLLYAAIKTILGMGQDSKKLIVNIVIVAILINFSLFFTKVVIDASNVLAVFFYDAIAPGALDQGLNQGLSGKLMERLYITSLWETSELGIFDKRTIIIGVMGTVVALLVAFILFAVAIMFVVRFVVLIFVLILSPVAFIAHILPGLEGKWKQWLDALIGQAFFAPIYFLLTWIVVVASRGLYTNTGGSMANAFIGSVRALDGGGSVVDPPKLDSLGILVNFIIMIALLITSLIIAKDWANKANGLIPGVGKFTGWATGAAGGVAFGGAGWAGRKTAGGLGALVSESAWLQKAAKEPKGFVGRTLRPLSRMGLYTTEKMAKGTYDVRNATIPTSVAGDLIRGTVGRTKTGKWLGLNDVNIPSVPVGSLAAEQAGVGKGGTKGYIETREDSRKRVREREAQSAEDLEQAKAEVNIKKGAKADPETEEGRKAIDVMERSMTRLSTSQIETLISNNRDLLESENVANKISIQQLEAINKSTNFSEKEKKTLNDKRFDKMYKALDRVKAAENGTEEEKKKAALNGDEINKIKEYSDRELELFDQERLLDPTFVWNLRGGQVETIVKSPRFTTRQKDNIREIRRDPLLKALKAVAKPAGAAADWKPDAAAVADVKKYFQKLSLDEVMTMMGNKGKNLPDGIGSQGKIGFDVTQHAAVLPHYTVAMIQRMAPKMTPDEITEMRDNLEKMLDAIPLDKRKDGKKRGVEGAVIIDKDLKSLADLEKWLGTPNALNIFTS